MTQECEPRHRQLSHVDQPFGGPVVVAAPRPGARSAGRCGGGPLCRDHPRHSGGVKCAYGVAARWPTATLDTTGATSRAARTREPGRVWAHNPRRADRHATRRSTKQLPATARRRVALLQILAPPLRRRPAHTPPRELLPAPATRRRLSPARSPRAKAAPAPASPARTTRGPRPPTPRRSFQQGSTDATVPADHRAPGPGGLAGCRCRMRP
jgi:hypothetical protein